MGPKTLRKSRHDISGFGRALAHQFIMVGILTCHANAYINDYAEAFKNPYPKHNQIPIN
jgi:hypothetical protein